MGALLQGRQARPEVCTHGDREPLGSEGYAEFFRCNACGVIVIAQGGHVWVLPASSAGTENQDFTF